MCRLYVERKEKFSIREHCFYLEWRHGHCSKSRKIYRHANGEIITNLFSVFPSFFLSIRSYRSIGNYKVAARRFLPFPVEMWRTVSGKIRFEVFTDKLCKSEERDNKVVVLFRWENSSIRLAFFNFIFYFSFCTKRRAIQLKLQNSFNVSMLLNSQAKCWV